MSKLCYQCLLETMNNGRCTSCGARASDQSVTDSSLLPPGTLLDDGSIIVGMPLGRGGFGATYVARDLQHNQLIALKEFVPHHMMVGRQGLNIQVLPDKQGIYAKSLRDFSREARLLGQMSHPNIVKVYFDLPENNTIYYGMELLQGNDLRKWVQNRLPLSPEESYQLLAPIMEALLYVHNVQKTLHRDISPDNIFIRTGPQYPGGYSPCLIDFGAACCAKLDFTQTAPGVKKSGFSPLEQNWAMEQQGTFTDVYALAATFYYLMTGQVPPPSTNRSLTNDPLKPPSALNPRLPKALDKVILDALQLSPSKRTQTVEQFNAALVSVIRPGVQPPPPPDTSHQRSPRLLLALLIDSMIFLGLPVGLLATTSPMAGYILGFLLMVGINTVLCTLSQPATLAQRMLHLQINDSPNPPSAGQILLYNFLRTLMPLPLIDEFIALFKGSRQSLTDRIGGVHMLIPSKDNNSVSSAAVHSNISGISNVPMGTDSTYIPRPAQHPSASLHCTSGMMEGKVFPLKKYNALGRGMQNATISFPEKESAISHLHCRIQFEDDGWYICDDTSRNGTYLNNTLLPKHESKKLQHGDTIKLGDEILVFKIS